MKEVIQSDDDLLEMLDSLLREPAGFWDNFYSDRKKGVPFFVNKPDENLVSYFRNGLIYSGNVLELGSGPGRNAFYFAKKGCQVDAVDLSEESIKWAQERMNEGAGQVNFIHANLFDFPIKDGAYDIVYDSGCFHHIAPHRRKKYLELVHRSLKPGGCFALTCFVEGDELGGSDISDWEVYRQRSLDGGLGFTEERLRTIFVDFTALEIRKMRQADSSEAVFGLSGLWTALFKKE